MNSDKQATDTQQLATTLKPVTCFFSWLIGGFVELWFRLNAKIQKQCRSYCAHCVTWQKGV